MACNGDFQEQEAELDNYILSAYKLWFNELTFYLESEEVSRLTQEDLINDFCEQVKGRLEELNIKTIWEVEKMDKEKKYYCELCGKTYDLFQKNLCINCFKLLIKDIEVV